MEAQFKAIRLWSSYASVTSSSLHAGFCNEWVLQGNRVRLQQFTLNLWEQFTNDSEICSEVKLILLREKLFSWVYKTRRMQ